MGPRLVEDRLRTDRPIENPQKAAERLRDRSKVPDLRLHDLPRTAASLMTGMGISRLTVKKILNHAERDITAVYDRHSFDPENRTALEAWGRRLEAIVSGLPKKGADCRAHGPRARGQELTPRSTRPRSAPR